MQSIKLFQHGQLFLPERVCQAHHWKTGQELVIIHLDEGILLKPKHFLKPTTLDEVAKCLPYQGPAKTLEDMEAAIAMELESQEESK